jgi:hypothetical protein
MTQRSDGLLELEAELGIRARQLLAGARMREDYPARLDARLRAAAERRGGRTPGRLAPRFAWGAASRVGLATVLATAIAVGGGVLIPSRAPTADAAQLVTRVLSANDVNGLTKVPPGMVRHLTVVTTTVNASTPPVVFQEWFGDEGRSVRLELPSGETMTLADGVGWMYLPEQRLARRVRLEEKRFEALGPGRFALTASALANAEAHIQGKSVALGRPATVIELSKPIDAGDPPKSRAARMRYQLTVDDATYEIRESRAATLDASGAVLDEVITRVTVDELLDAARFAPDHFRFEPGPGILVETE